MNKAKEYKVGIPITPEGNAYSFSPDEVQALKIQAEERGWSLRRYVTFLLKKALKDD